MIGLAVPWRGDETGGTVELFSAVAVCLFAFLLGSLPMHVGAATTADGAFLRVFFAMFLRFGATIALCLTIVITSGLDTATFLVWVAIAYVCLLPVDTVLAVRTFRGDSD